MPDGIKDLGVDDRVMRAFVSRLFVADASDVDRVRQKMLERTPSETRAALRRSRQVGSMLGSDAHSIQRPDHLTDRAELEIEVEDHADGLGLRFVDDDCHGSL